MKRLVVLLIVLVAGCFTTVAQSPNMPVDPDSKMIKYQDVIPEAGTPGVLYDRGASWISNYYKSPTSVLKIQDKANGKIEGTGRVPVSYLDEKGNKLEAGVILYDIKMEFKQDKYRYTLTNFAMKATSKVPMEKWLNKNDPAYNPKWDSYLYQVDTTMQGLVKSMKAGMKPVEIKKDEW